MKTVNVYLNFEGNTLEAFEFYRSVFGGEFLGVVRFRDFGENGMGVAEEDLDKIAHVALPLGPNNILMGTDVVGSMGKGLRQGNNFYLSLSAESGDEADRLFDALSANGKVEMPLSRTEWAEKYGSCVDRYGVRWMVDYTGSVQFAMNSAS